MTAAKYPWDYYRSKEQSPELQATCFRSFFQTWSDQDAVAGYLVWEWRNHPHHHEERSYVPYGREPTMKVIQEYFAKPPRPGRAATTAPVSRPVLSPAREGLRAPAKSATSRRSESPAPASRPAKAVEPPAQGEPPADDAEESGDEMMIDPPAATPPLDQPEN